MLHAALHVVADILGATLEVAARYGLAG